MPFSLFWCKWDAKPEKNVFVFTYKCCCVNTVHPWLSEPPLSEFLLILAQKSMDFFMNFVIIYKMVAILWWIGILTTCILLVVFPLTVCMLESMLEVQKGVMEFRIILVIWTIPYLNSLQNKCVQIIENALYRLKLYVIQIYNVGGESSNVV